MNSVEDENIITLEDDTGEKFDIKVSKEDYQKIINGDYEFANKLLQREIELKNRLLAYQLLLRKEENPLVPPSSSISEKQGQSSMSALSETNSQLQDEAENSSNTTSDSNANALSQRWSDSETKLLIDIYRSNYEKLSDKKYKTKSIYFEIGKHFPRFSTEQVESKIKNLKKTYKSILDNNNKTGRGRIDWPYFESLQDIFGGKPENNPLSIASNTLGFVENTEKPGNNPLNIASNTLRFVENTGIEINDSTDTDNEVAGPSTKRSLMSESDINAIPFKKNKRSNKLATSQPEWVKEFRQEMATRHQERMQKQDEFLKILKDWMSKQHGH